MDTYLLKELELISHSMFHKNYFGVFHGSISAKVDIQSFVINKKEVLLGEINQDGFIRLICGIRKDYRWKDASGHSLIHEAIYTAMPNAKYITYTLPPHATAYTFKHDVLIPRDFYGYKHLGEMEIYDPKSFSDWEERAAYEISRYFQNNNKSLLLIKGFGLISYDRDLKEMVKKVAILENSCRLLMLNAKS